MKLKTKIVKDVCSGEKNLIEIYAGDMLLTRIKITQPSYTDYLKQTIPVDYITTVFPVALPNVMQLGVLGHGYKLTRK